MPITYARLAREASYLACRITKWTADCLATRTDFEKPMHSPYVKRFTEMLRSAADDIDRIDEESN